MTRLNFRPTATLAAFFCAFVLTWSVAPSNQTPLFAADEKEEETSYAPEYPDDEPIDVVPTEIVGYRLLKTFDFTDPAEPIDEWRPNEVVALSRGPRTLVVEMNAEDPYFFSPALDNIPQGSIIVRMRLRRTNTGVGQLFFETADHTYEEAHSTQFKLYNDDKFHDYAVLLEADAPILNVRFDIGGNAGTTELEKIEFFAIETAPLKFGVATLEDGRFLVDLVNSNPEVGQVVDTEFYGVNAQKGASTTAIKVADHALVDRSYPQTRPFEEMEIVAKVRATGEIMNRRYFTFNESACAPAPADTNQDEAPTLRSGKLAVRFAPDASGAEIFRDGVRVAVIAPLLYEEGDGAAIITPKRDYLKELSNQAPSDDAPASNGRIAPVFRSVSENGREITFDLCEISLEDARKALDGVSAEKKNDHASVGSLKFKLDDETLAFAFESPRKIHAPVLRVLGTMKQATLPGVEYLEEGEHSSSTADIKTADHVRYAPPVLWITQPYAAITTDRGSVVLAYDDPKTQPVFAVPDFIDGDATSSRMNVCATAASGKIRVAPPAPLEDSILWAVRDFGLPEPPTAPRDAQAGKKIVVDALEKSIVATPEGWCHALFDDKQPYAFEPTYGSDFISTIWEITGKLPKTPRVDFRGAHIPNYAAFFVAGQGKLVATDFKNQIRFHASQIRPDGSCRYYGKYLWGNKTDYASGNCGNHLYELGEIWSFTGDKDALAAILKGCDFMNAQLTPRGAQVWELSLHTPDIMGSSRCCMANVWAYEGTGDKKYLDAARRWAISGLPFVYLWEDSSIKPFDASENVGGDYQPMMKYATIAVFGATNWVAPNWMGRPVQWCGLDFAHALILLAKHDQTLDWLKIADGVVASAECQLCVEGNLIGLLPDSVELETQERYAPYITPCVVYMLRRMIEGEHTNLSVVDLDDKRVASPFPARVEDGVVKISAKKGLVYQIMIDGEEIRTIKSNGEDVVRL